MLGLSNRGPSISMHEFRLVVQHSGLLLCFDFFGFF
jgi:hypothetical protein